MLDIKKHLNRLIRRVFVFVGVHLHAVENEVARRTLPRFGTKPKNLHFARPRFIDNPENIYLGDDIVIGPGSVLKTMVWYPESEFEAARVGSEPQKLCPKLVIGNRVTATGALQVYAVSSVVIEDDVMFATNVFVFDAFHGYESVMAPYKDQPWTRVAPIRIGRGCWIGQDVLVTPGVTIGDMAIIGANSVVTKDVPAYSIALGVPARVVKRWDEEVGAWAACG